MSEVLNIELNPKQVAIHRAIFTNQADGDDKGGVYTGGFEAGFVGGRGSGKSNVLLRVIADSAFALPRAVAGMGAMTYRQVQDIILSQSQGVWEQYGLQEYDPKTRFGHYVINRKPPEHWRKAWNAPKSYDNTVAFCNGYTLRMLSGDRPETQRGLNLDQFFCDESATVKKDFINKIIRPAIRANKYKYLDTRKGRKGYNHPAHWLIAHFTSAPWLPSGQWVYETEAMAQRDPRRYFYIEATAHDNQAFLPGNFIEKQREILTPLEFDVEIDNKRLTKLPNAFYASFDGEKHTYFNGLAYDFDEVKRVWVPKARDYDTLKPFRSTWDFNAHFTSVSLAQQPDGELRFVDTLYVKQGEPTLVDALCAKFIDKYKHHLKKTIYLHGDQGGKKGDPGRKPWFEQIKSRLKAAGWEVIDCVQRSYPPYHIRYKVINAVLSEQNPRMPKIRINQNECKPLIISLQNTPVDGATFEKDKGSEKQVNVPQEYATHLSDGFDYLVFDLFAKFVDNVSTRSSGVVVQHD